MRAAAFQFCLAFAVAGCSLFAGRIKDVEVTPNGVRLATDAPEVSSSTVTRHSDGSTRVDVYRHYVHECSSAASASGSAPPVASAAASR